MHYFLLSLVDVSWSYWLDLSTQNVINESDFRKSQKKNRELGDLP